MDSSEWIERFRLIDLETELVATEELIVRIGLETEGLQRERAVALHAKDPIALQNRIQGLEREAANLRNRIVHEEDLAKRLADLPAPRRVK